MNKFSIIAIIVAILFGAIAGSVFTSHKAEKELLKQKHDHEKALEHQADSLLQIIHKRDVVLVKLQDQVKDDSIRIQGMLYKIQQDGVRTEQKRVEAKKLTTNEKIDWINRRYKSVLQ